MRFGISIPNFGEYADVRLVAEMAHEMEEAGWDGLFVWDHINPRWGDVPFSDPWMLLTAIALRTERLRIGPMVTPIPRRRPWKLSREVVTLDHISNGRVIFGVGMGHGEEFSAYHEPGDDKQHGEMLDEALDVLTLLWSGEQFSHAGKYYQLDNVRYLPPPVQQPRIPIWVAGTWPRRKPMRRAARWDGVFPLSCRNGGFDPMTFDELRDCMTFIRSQQSAGKAEQPYDLVHASSFSYKDRSADSALIAEYAEIGVTWLIEGPQGNDTLNDLRLRLRQGPPR